MKLSMLFLSTLTLATSVLSANAPRVVRGPADTRFPPRANGCGWACPTAPAGNYSTASAIRPSGGYYRVAPTGGLSVPPKINGSVIVPSSSSSSSKAPIIIPTLSPNYNNTVRTPTPTPTPTPAPSSAAIQSSSSSSIKSPYSSRIIVPSAPLRNSTAPAPAPRLTGTGALRPPRVAKPSTGFVASTGAVPIPSASPLLNAGAAVVDIQFCGSFAALAVAVVVMVLQ